MNIKENKTGELDKAYANTCTCSQRKDDFDPDKIINYLMELGVDIGNMAQTPDTVWVNMERSDYTKKGIGNSMRRKFNVAVKCDDNRITFYNLGRTNSI